MTERGRKLSDRVGGVTVVLFVCWLCATVAGCVGEYSSPGGGEQEEEFDRTLIAADTTRGTFTDTVSPIRYHVFETRVESATPLIAEYRIMALEEGRPEALAKTLRTLLDSIAVAETGLVAARGILYTYVLTAPRRGKLKPSVWGEWAPISGWDSATIESRAEPHRIYTYSERPDW